METQIRQFLYKNIEVEPICKQLNLDVKKLHNQDLMANPIYRRLYNIVINDMSRSDLNFRKNLIAQLYFLLQITPVIRKELQNHFLEEVEKLYNINDHKKIDLASNKLASLLQIVNLKKDTSTISQERPKTGVVWNQNVSPFLRPYTASKKHLSRPQSSKKVQSTNADTIDTYEIKDFTTNIEEQHQISEDFKNKHRTNHPQYQPVYERLFQIIKKIEGKDVEENKMAQSSIKMPSKQSRFIKSAVPKTKTFKIFQQEIKSQHNASFNERQAELENDQILNKNEQHSSKSEDSEQQQEQYLYINDKKKPYKAYATNQKQESNIPLDDHYQLNKYQHFLRNKVAQGASQDKQMTKRMIEYTRIKSAIKKQQNRKFESRRLMSAKHTRSAGTSFKKLEIKNQRQTEFPSNCIDLTKQNQIKQEKINPYPTYNQRQILKPMYERQIDLFKKRNPIDPISVKLKNQPLTQFQRFFSPVKFDPMSIQNTKKHNQIALEQIEKIKSKLGGKCYASTESLMKALVIDIDQNSYMKGWQNKSPFYGLISNGAKVKKMKKKGRKLQKSSKKIKRQN